MKTYLKKLWSILKDDFTAMIIIYEFFNNGMWWYVYILYCGWKGNLRQVLNNNKKSLKEKFTRKTIINALIRVKHSDGRILNSQGTTHDFIDYIMTHYYKMNSEDFTNPLLSSRALWNISYLFCNAFYIRIQTKCISLSSFIDK